MKLLKISCGLLLAFSFCSAYATEHKASAKGDAAKGTVLAKNTCAACHGADGNTSAGAFPRLAGQHTEYLQAQLAAFKSGVRKAPAMTGVVSGLTPQAMLDVAAYFAQQTPKKNVATDKNVLALGKTIYKAGRTGNATLTDVPACASCHSANGAGMPSQYPRLAGQNRDYTLSQLKAFASKERNHAVMSAIAARMTETEMKAVAEYMQGLY